MFAIGEFAAFSTGPFIIIYSDESTIELESDTTHQFWMVKKFDKDGYPPVVLYHRHGLTEQYHVHFVYEQDNALLAYSEIMQHDKYIMKRDAKRKKITSLSNKQLLYAAFA